jgi:hypothetical protein
MAHALTDSPAPLSLHVGFIRAGSCDASTRGAACGVASPEQFLRSEWCQTVSNVSGAIADAFACLGDFGAEDCGPAQPLSADLGAADCAPAQPLAAVSQLLAGAPAAGWENFLRPDAYLMIVIIAGGDDASGAPGAPIPVSDVVTFVRSLKPNPYQIMVSAVAPASCAAGGAPPARLVEFVQAFGANGVLVDLCDGRLAPALLRLGTQIQTSIDPGCARAVRDVDPETPGLQADCTFLDWKPQPNDQWSASPIPSCDRAPPPCWRLVPGYCGGDGYVVDIERGPDWCLAIPTYVTIECLSCANANDPACAQVVATR